MKKYRTKGRKKEQVRMGLAAGRELGKHPQAQAAAAGHRTAPKKWNSTKCPCKAAKHQPHTGACLSESSRELSSSSWGSHVTQRKMSGVLLKKFKDYIIPFGT